MTVCKYWDCGWCYAPNYLKTNSINSACVDPNKCPISPLSEPVQYETPMTDLKLCKDCKWYKKDWFSHLSGAGDCDDRCLNPVLSENLITGKRKGGCFCYNKRLDYGGCGPEGKYWESRK